MDDRPHDGQAQAGITGLAGLCERCRHMRLITSARGSRFYLCQLSFTDPRFPRYPPLPVTSCAGFAPADDVPRRG